MAQTFNLGTLAPGFPASATISADDTADTDVMAAILANTAFPARELSLGSLNLSLGSPADGTATTPLGTVSYKASASGRLGIGIYDSVTSLNAALNFKDAGDLSLAWDTTAGYRYVLLVAGYDVSGSASGTSPVGMLGSVTFGVSGDQASDYAIVLRFPSGQGASTTINTLLKQWRTPSMINSATDLDKGATILLEIDGSLSTSIGAQIGYNFSFLQSVSSGLLTGDIGLKVATALSTQLGFSASGQYILAVSRAVGDPGTSLRVQLFKLSTNGWTFAFDLTVGATGVVPSTPTSDQVISAIFGVHAKQAIADLQALSQWTSSTQDTSTYVAGLVTTQAQALLTKVTKIDAVANLGVSLQKFMAGLQAWQSLPGKTSAWILGKLQATMSPSDLSDLQNALGALASPTDSTVNSFISGLIQKSGFDQTVAGQFLDSIADQGVLPLLEDIPTVRSAAQNLQQLLNGQFLQDLQQQVDSALDLTQLNTAVSWASVNSWLVARLSNFFGQTLGLDQLNAVRTTVQQLEARWSTIYQEVQKAVTSTYQAKFAYAYNSSTTNSALVDVTFDFSQANAATTYNTIVSGGAWDRLFVGAPLAGVTFANSVLAHGISRNTSIQLTLPGLQNTYTDVSSSIAQLTVHSDGSSLIGSYTLSASDEVTSSAHFDSQLVLTVAGIPAGLRGASVRVAADITSKWSYVYRYIEPSASLADMKTILDPIALAYFSGLFPAQAEPFDTWLLDLDQAVSQKLGNSSNNFGNVLVSLEVSLPADIFSSWFVQRNGVAQLSAQCAVSKAIQQTLRAILLTSYANDPSHWHFNSEMNSLLVYASLPLANNVTLDDGTLTFTTDDYYWNWPSSDLLAALCSLPQTVASLSQNMSGIYQRLLSSGNTSQASFFSPSNAPAIINSVVNPNGQLFLPITGLLQTECTIVRDAGAAITAIAAFMGNVNVNPAAALTAFSKFGDSVGSAFNADLSSNYIPNSINAVGSALFHAATLALNPSSIEDTAALMSVLTLNPSSSFKMSDFLTGSIPDTSTDVALEQRLLTSS
jgi:hypothetical protein